LIVEYTRLLILTINLSLVKKKKQKLAKLAKLLIFNVA